MTRINSTETNKKISNEDANSYAKNIIESYNNIESSNNPIQISSNIEIKEKEVKKEEFNTKYGMSEPQQLSSTFEFNNMNDNDKFALF